MLYPPSSTTLACSNTIFKSVIVSWANTFEPFSRKSPSSDCLLFHRNRSSAVELPQSVRRERRQLRKSFIGDRTCVCDKEFVRRSDLATLHPVFGSVHLALTRSHIRDISATNGCTASGESVHEFSPPRLARQFPTS
jgi:hypothetical protein